MRGVCNLSIHRVFDFLGPHPEASPGALLEALVKLPALLFRSILSKTAFAALTLGGFLFFACAPAAKASDWDDCNRRAAYTDMRYHEALEHFGPFSPAARHWAHERREAYEHLARCRRDWRQDRR